MTLEEEITKLNKDYGKGSVIKFNELQTGEYESISTDSIDFDNKLGTGGFVLGKMYEVMSWEGCGKTTLCGHLSKNAQIKYPNRKVLYVDSEHALDLNYFKNIGVDVDNLLINQPSNGEEGFNVAERLIKTGEISLCIFDSDTGLKPKSEIDGEIGDQSIGKKAKMNSQAYPKLHNAIADNKTCLVVLSQYREKIGVMFGSPVTTSGGMALRFYADCRIELSKTLHKEDDIAIANKVKAKIVKHKMSSPFVTAEFKILFGKGIWIAEELYETLKSEGLIKKWGKKITFNEKVYEMEESEFINMITDNEDFKTELETKIKEKLNG